MHVCWTDLGVREYGCWLLSMSAEGSPAQLLTVLPVPTDDVVFGVFTAAAGTPGYCAAGRHCRWRWSAAVDGRTVAIGRRYAPWHVDTGQWGYGGSSITLSQRSLL